jgi:hypothetical protein
MFQQLVAEPAARNHESVIEPIDSGKPKTPIDMIGLILVGQTLEIKDDLV